MTQISTKPPSGMRDFLAPDLARRRHAIAVIRRVYESFGFAPLETPTIENLSTLLGKYGPEGDQLLYRILHRRERLARALEPKADGSRPTELDLADEGLRYDLTVPLARVVANYPELPAFYKRYQIQPVWRADRPAKGRFREFFQCDVDVCGTKSLVAEAEVCGAVATVLLELGFAKPGQPAGSFRILVNHRELLRAMVAEAGIDAALEGVALIALDKLDKIGADGVLAELVAKGIGAGAAAKLLEVLAAARAPGFLAARAGAATRPGSAAAKELVELLAIAAAGPAGPHLAFDPTLARGLSYYTGPIFEIAVDGLAGSMGGGGRYDGLIGMFTKRQIPAVGFSLGLERVLLVMEERGMFPPLATGPELLLCRFPDVSAADAIRVATQLRAERIRPDGARERGLRVELFADAPAIGKQLQYANAIGAPFAGLLGSDELAQQSLTLKKLATGEQKTLPLAAVAASVRSG
ncbi:MAG: histidine--tRNA ligase [Planctomycetes bacterium]|nr:histidine--tRNA ligase [Planctomycetota bacterium]